ncbi:MAG: hypothetical protein RW306_14355 [Geobacteraceae bacterium]|nr:hypothetical protein [Geobacteraceae bacterium]
MKQRNYLKRKLARPAIAESKYKLSDFVSFVALVLTLATALFYYLGCIYYSAYLSYWGLPEAIFSLSREQSIISGLFAYAIICARELIYPLMSLIYLAEALAVIAFLCTVRRVKDFLYRHLRKLFHFVEPHVTRHLDTSDTHERTINRFVIGMLIVALPLVFTFAISKTASWANKQGEEVAKTEFERIDGVSAPPKHFGARTILYVRNEAKGFDQYSGHLINTSSTHTALYRKDTGVSIFPLANVARMVTSENKTMVKQ